MNDSRRPSRRATGVLAGLLLLLTGCAADVAADRRVGDVDPPKPAAASSAFSPPTVTPTQKRGSAERAETSPAAVPQYRATLPPPSEEGPRPTRFRADRAGIDLPVISTGVAEDGGMELPQTNREVGWYAYGARPGDAAGATVLAAHVDTRAEGLGPFARLRELDDGDELEVVDASGRRYSYTVTSVDDVKKSDIALDELFRLDGAAELKVVTCGGPYRRATGYRDNIVVTARPR